MLPEVPFGLCPRCLMSLGLAGSNDEKPNGAFPEALDFGDVVRVSIMNLSNGLGGAVWGWSTERGGTFA